MKSYNFIKNLFIKYFIKNNHTLLESSSLVPYNDPSLLFTNAGMNQFKDIFLGTTTNTLKRVVTVQRCLRLGGKHNDVNLIGYSNQHHTFFEMLGNFSFNDYAKEQAIKYAWELLTNICYLNISPDKLLVTVHNNDIESFNIWHNCIGLSKSKIIKTGSINTSFSSLIKSDNFWQMDDTGPCGLSTEIFYDINNLIKNNYEINKCNLNNDKFLEIWNIVFIEYYKQLNNEILYKLNKFYIDTGMGLERITAVLQNVNSTYNIDLFKKIILLIKQFIPNKYNHIIPNNSLYIISDHLRAILWIMLDGIYPSNNKRGYILKKLIRRVIYHSYYYLNIKNNFLSNLILPLLTIMKLPIPVNINNFKDCLIAEEKKFIKIIINGNKLLSKSVYINKNQQKCLDAKIAFNLYDTYGIPLDLIQELCNKNNIYLDNYKLNIYIAKQKLLSKLPIKIKHQNIYHIRFINTKVIKNYNCQIINIFYFNILKQQLVQGELGNLILSKSNFLPSIDREIGDQGLIMTNDKQFIFKVINTTIDQHNNIIHFGKVMLGKICINNVVNTIVNPFIRHKININHTSMHLLKACLKNYLCLPLKIKNYYISDKKFSIDINNDNNLSKTIINKLENIINSYIYTNSPIKIIYNHKHIRLLKINNLVLHYCYGININQLKKIKLLKLNLIPNINKNIIRIEGISHNIALNYI